MASYCPFSIRCLRSVTNKGDDDIIQITPIKNETSGNIYEFNIDYTFPSKTANSSELDRLTTFSMTMSYSNMFPYLHNLMNTLKADEEPFLSVQFDLPWSPSIIVRTKNIDTIRNSVIDQFYTIACFPGAWPVKKSNVVLEKKEEVKTSVAKQPSSKAHKFFDEDGHTIPDEERKIPYRYDCSFDNEV